MRVGIFTESYDPIINGVSTSVKTLTAELLRMGPMRRRWARCATRRTTSTPTRLRRSPSSRTLPASTS